ncbi:hypothetical protein TRFO_33695 [Tritrichomonas foetus]|uniref:Zinc finger PHD-type domain-containing protein n=1 Tax=Tritrichomonas foetus TaxID=1144522 RepID=A0A1J4JM58_9EUKA|nr:hypothetical protein TRFO_33695 [Tritrichomonas foetus]|eukprot:OHS99777.1 hypothetical protein TRFO_33695 [Tritrichomonas foetus]
MSIEEHSSANRLQEDLTDDGMNGHSLDSSKSAAYSDDVNNSAKKQLDIGNVDDAQNSSPDRNSPSKSSDTETATEKLVVEQNQLLDNPKEKIDGSSLNETELKSVDQQNTEKDKNIDKNKNNNIKAETTSNRVSASFQNIVNSNLPKIEVKPSIIANPNLNSNPVNQAQQQQQQQMTQYQQQQIYQQHQIQQQQQIYQQYQQQAVNPHNFNQVSSFLTVKPDPAVNVRFENGNIPTAATVASMMPRSVSVSQFRGSVQVQSPAEPPRRVVPTSSRGSNTLIPPEPAYFEDSQTGKYGIRCVCKKGAAEGLLIQCDSCGFWLHGHCVCMARSTRESFICPFCYGRAIRCHCGQNTRYDMPIVQCQKCKFYVHKNCEDLMFGIVPHNFICRRCGGREYLLPKITLKDNLIPNRTSFIECNRFEILQSIPEGRFRNFVVSDLSKTELSLHETIGRYFQEFAVTFFEDNHEFWKTFVETFTTILMCDKSMVMQAIDAFAYSLLYKTYVGKPYYSNLPTKFGLSESVALRIDSMNLKRMEKPPTPVPLYVDQDGHVRTSQTLDDEQFIVDLPGFLMLSDELNADDGIPSTCFAVTDKEFIVDLEGSSFHYAHNFQRSFHFNTVVKMYRLGDDPRVGLFATRLKGPISEEKGKRGPAVQHDMPLILPFDGEIPFNTPKIEWKERKTKNRPAPKPRNQQNNGYKSKNTNHKHRTVASRRNIKQECPVALSLLSAFCEDIVPPMPFTLLTEKEFAERHKQEEMAKSRHRNHRVRNLSDDD